MKTFRIKGKCQFEIITVVFVILKLAIHLFANHYELHRDEMLYFNMGVHPAWGYLTVPPVTGWLAFIVNGLFGNTFLGIRIMPALAGALTFFVASRIVRLLGGGISALLITLTTLLVMPGELLMFSIFTPNAFENLLWTLIIIYILKLLISEKPGYWLIIGILAGVSFMTKYSVLFLIAGFFIAFLFFPQRKLLFSWWFVAGIFAGLIVISPNIIWQYNHNWPVQFHFEELKKTQLDNLKYSYFFIDLFSLTSVSFIIPLFGLLMLLFSKQQKYLQLSGLAILVVFLLFIVTKGKAYYVFGTLPFLTVAGGVYAGKIIKSLKILYPSLSLIWIYSLLSFPFVIPVLSFQKLEQYANSTKGWVAAPFMRWEDGKEHAVSQIYADMTGWEELTNLVGKAFNRLPEKEINSCTIFCQKNYGDAGAINFYGGKCNLPEPVTMHESYIFWAPDTIPLGPVIYIYYDIGDLENIFKNIEEIGTIDNPHFREKGLKVFLCKDPKPELQDIYKSEVTREKNRFTRIN